MSVESLVYIIILNWNGWQDTIECLESVFRLDYSNYKVIVCDNASSDDSIKHIEDWAEGKLDVNIPDAAILRKYSYPPVAKPISYVEYPKEIAEKGGGENDAPELVLINTGGNLGFAGGNNVGIRYVQAKGDYEYIWLLNNDTVVDPAALTYLRERMIAMPEAGICGSTLLYYDSPSEIQSLGGATYNKWLGISKVIRTKSKDKSSIIDYVEKKMDYVIGTSMLISRQFFDTVGLLEESYFLYYEELDLAVRSSSFFELAYAPESIVYHKEGKSIGTSSKNL